MFDSIIERISTAKDKVVAGIGATAGALMSMGSGNYTAAYTPVAASQGLINLTDMVAFILDVMTAVGNWFVTNVVGEICIAMSVVMFAFILIKSFFRRGGGRRR